MDTARSLSVLMLGSKLGVIWLSKVMAEALNFVVFYCGLVPRLEECNCLKTNFTAFYLLKIKLVQSQGHHRTLKPINEY